jgi:uncharacterized ubiquitin-like protein YukD
MMLSLPIIIEFIIIIKIVNLHLISPQKIKKFPFNMLKLMKLSPKTLKGLQIKIKNAKKTLMETKSICKE